VAAGRPPSSRRDIEKILFATIFLFSFFPTTTTTTKDYSKLIDVDESAPTKLISFAAAEKKITTGLLVRINGAGIRFAT